MVGNYKVYKISAKVISQTGFCTHGHKVGDEWLIEGKTPPGFSIKAFAALLPQIWLFRLGGSIPWGTDPNVTVIACPDPKNPVVFELRRLSD